MCLVVFWRCFGVLSNFSVIEIALVCFGEVVMMDMSIRGVRVEAGCLK